MNKKKIQTHMNICSDHYKLNGQHTNKWGISVYDYISNYGHCNADIFIRICKEKVSLVLDGKIRVIKSSKNSSKIFQKHKYKFSEVNSTLNY